MTAKSTSIYGLIDPRNNQLRYVGKTVKPVDERFRNHLSFARRSARQRVSRWIRGLLLCDKIPEYFVIEVIPAGGDWQEAERHWISYFRSIGCRLTNLTDGGEGASGFKQPPHIGEMTADRNSEPWFIKRVTAGIARHKSKNPEFWKSHYAKVSERNKRESFISVCAEGQRLYYTKNPDRAKDTSERMKAWWADNDNKESTSQKLRDSYTPERRSEYKSMATSWMAKRREIYERCLTLASLYEVKSGSKYGMPANVTQHSTEFWRDMEKDLIAANHSIHVQSVAS